MATNLWRAWRSGPTPAAIWLTVWLLGLLAGMPAGAATYYLSPAGSDSNSGATQALPWLTPNHAVNCGDVLLAVPSTAYFGNLGRGQWGAVSCPGNNNVAWVKCMTFDACKSIVPNGTKANAVDISANYWGVQGFEASNLQTDTNNSLGCFNAEPWTTPLHHIIYANNVAITCPLSAFGGGILYGSSPALSVDYEVIVGNIAYGGGNNASCGSNIGLYMPIAVDSQPGTHIYIAGNFSIAATNPSGCYDANGITLDTFDDDNSTWPGLAPFGQQVVIDNNISIGNGGVGIRMEYNNALQSGVTGAFGAQIARHNTTWGNGNGSNAMYSPDGGEIQLFSTSNTSATSNLAVAAFQYLYQDPYLNNQTGTYNYLAPVQAENVDATDSVAGNWLWSAWDNQPQINDTNTGFAYGTNVFADPGLTAPAVPGSPSCGSYADVPHCMATVVANFKPTGQAAQTYGYQVPLTTLVSDALFPQWLCNVNLPPGLVTLGCATLLPMRNWVASGTILVR